MDKVLKALNGLFNLVHSQDSFEKAQRCFDIVEEAILELKSQKKYLKWDDIEFSYGTKTQKVRMGDTIYKIEYVYYDNVKEVKLLSEDEKCYYLGFTGNYKDNIQLFNDLHLEVIE